MSARVCAAPNCRNELLPPIRAHARYCSARCRQAGLRQRKASPNRHLVSDAEIARRVERARKPKARGLQLSYRRTFDAIVDVLAASSYDRRDAEHDAMLITELAASTVVGRELRRRHRKARRAQAAKGSRA